MKYRKNINCLSTDELHDLREALAIMFVLPDSSEHSFLTVAGYHGEPGNYCMHGAPGFFTWHRAYLLNLEEALHCLNPDVMVPYWNWSSGPTTGLPAACSSATYVNRDGDTVANPLYSGPLPSGGPGTSTSRGASIDTTTFDDLADTAQLAMDLVGFDDFQSAISSVHGSVHVRVGGNMSSVPYAAYDPIFYLHHTNVDRLWALWQSSHSDPLPSDEASFELDPFVVPCDTALYTGDDVFSTSDLGYGYTYFCWRIIGPFVFGTISLRKVPWIWEGFESAKLVFRSDKMPSRSMEIRVFLNQPDATEKTKTIGNPRFAGSLGLFGMMSDAGMAKGRSKRAVGGTMSGMGTSRQMKGERFDLQMDITAALNSHKGRHKDATLTFVAVDLNGKRITKPVSAFRQLELHTA